MSEPGEPGERPRFNLGSYIVHLVAGMPICQLILEEVREVPTDNFGLV